MRLLFWVSLAFILNLTISCQKSEEIINPKTLETNVSISGYGGKMKIDLEKGNWEILKVTNAKSNEEIFGDILTLDGEVLRSNIPLKLDTFGVLSTNNSDWGIEIEYTPSGSIDIFLKENSSDEELNIILELRNEGSYRKVIVEQPKSQGWEFRKIDFFLNNNDGDSLYMREKLMIYEFNIPNPREMQINPFFGKDVFTNSFFDNYDKPAFPQIKGEGIKLPIPSDIINGEVFISEREQIYGDNLPEKYENNVTESIRVPAGNSKFYVNIEERKRKISYKLTLEKRGAKGTKEIYGKWIEVSPTGIYKLFNPQN